MKTPNFARKSKVIVSEGLEKVLQSNGEFVDSGGLQSAGMNDVFASEIPLFSTGVKTILLLNPAIQAGKIPNISEWAGVRIAPQLETDREPAAESRSS